jgi:hypothetical protein
MDTERKGVAEMDEASETVRTAESDGGVLIGCSSLLIGENKKTNSFVAFPT